MLLEFPEWKMADRGSIVPRKFLWSAEEKKYQGQYENDMEQRNLKSADHICLSEYLPHPICS